VSPDLLPAIVSVDDHLLEPPDLWQSRLPKRDRELGPRVVRERATLGFDVKPIRGEGPWCDWWVYGDTWVPTFRLSAAAGFTTNDYELVPITYDEMRPGCFQLTPRLHDMDLNGVEVSMCFPTFPRFCGQTFLEAPDKDLALRCVRAYNDWMVDDWCAPSGRRLVPLCLVPLWDPELAAAEVRRNAARGVRAVSFSENPAALGLPSLFDRHGHWDAFLGACEHTGTVVCLHIGSSSRRHTTAPDAPPAVFSTIEFTAPVGALADWLLSGVFVRFPDIVMCLAEGQIGWIPYLLERADKVWTVHHKWGGVAETVPDPPSSYFRGRVYGCVYDDDLPRHLIEAVGIESITFEVDYPHSQTTWPHTKEVAARLLRDLSSDEAEMILRSNARRMLKLDEADK